MAEPEDPLAALGRDPELASLGRTMRAELRAEAEEYEALAAKDLARSRRLAEVALLHCHRGDLVECVSESAVHVGRLSYVAGDLACLLTSTLEVDLAVGGLVTLRALERARRGGTSPARGSLSFRARLLEHEVGGGAVTLGVRRPVETCEGRIAAVAVDHLVLAEPDGTTRYVALAAVDWARRPRR